MSRQRSFPINPNVLFQCKTRCVSGAKWWDGVLPGKPFPFQVYGWGYSLAGRCLDIVVRCKDQFNGYCGSWISTLSICWKIPIEVFLNQDDSWKDRIGFDGEILQIKVGASYRIALCVLDNYMQGKVSTLITSYCQTILTYPQYTHKTSSPPRWTLEKFLHLTTGLFTELWSTAASIQDLFSITLSPNVGK